jgi:hypothetical protein
MPTACVEIVGRILGRYQLSAKLRGRSLGNRKDDLLPFCFHALRTRAIDLRPDEKAHLLAAYRAAREEASDGGSE